MNEIFIDPASPDGDKCQAVVVKPLENGRIEIVEFLEVAKLACRNELTERFDPSKIRSCILWLDASDGSKQEIDAQTGEVSIGLRNKVEKIKDIN